MASVLRTGVLLAAITMPGGTGAVPHPAVALVRGDTAHGVLLSLGSVLLLAGAAAATARHCRTRPAGPLRPGTTEWVASAAPEGGDG
ncbi:hypothetical protein ACFV4P_26305 [Kitasatospora sp. NPDC059795]|uniref:hypothetical protein n=1 Tax=Kitasatospora sp. NPDC059795 TaxID=3346949 RepID=UPI00364A76D1